MATNDRSARKVVVGAIQGGRLTVYTEAAHPLLIARRRPGETNGGLLRRIGKDLLRCEASRRDDRDHGEVHR